MWFVTHYRSNTRIQERTRYLALSFVALFAVAVPSIFGGLVTTDRYIVTETAPVGEDQYVTAVSGVIEGTINGDLTIFTGSLSISGEVTGNVTVFSSGTVTVTETGRIGGSLNGSSSALSMRGSVGSDVFFTAGSVVIEESGIVGRDLLAFGGTTRVDGEVGRDLRGRSFRSTVDGTVGGDVDIATQSLSIGATASVSGDVVYRSPADADIAGGASIAGTITKLPTQSNFIYSLVLSLANIIGFLGFVVAGLVALWLFRASGARAVGAILTRPIRSFLVGLGVVILVPFVVVLLAVTLVGIPLSVVVVAVAAIGFVVGAVPAVTALGNRILLNKGGLFGAFLVGAILWRLGIWLIPVVGGALFAIGLVWGIGAWVLGVVATRRADPIPISLIPASMVAGSGAPDDWEPPKAPGREELLESVDDDIEPRVTVESTAGIAEPEQAADAESAVADEVEAAESDGEAPEPEEADPVEPDPSRVRDASSEESTIRFDTEAAPPSQAEPVDRASSEPAAATDSSDTGGAPEDEDAPGQTLEERLASLRKHLDEAEPEDSEPFADFFKERGSSGSTDRPGPDNDQP